MKNILFVLAAVDIVDIVDISICPSSSRYSRLPTHNSRSIRLFPTHAHKLHTTSINWLLFAVKKAAFPPHKVGVATQWADC